jgi:hypothetical protein
MRLRRLRLLVLAFAFVGIGCRLFPRPQPKITIIETGQVTADISTLAPGLIGIEATTTGIDHVRNKPCWRKVMARE